MQQQSFRNIYINLECSECMKSGGHRKNTYYLRRCYSNGSKIESKTSVTSNEAIIQWFYCALCSEEAFYIPTHFSYLFWICYEKSTTRCVGTTPSGLLSRPATKCKESTAVFSGKPTDNYGVIPNKLYFVSFNFCDTRRNSR